MKVKRIVFLSGLVTVGLLSAAAPAAAGVDVGVFIGVPGTVIQPAPVVVYPAPVYSQPAPVIVHPRPIYRTGYDRHVHHHHWHQKPRWHGHGRPHFRGDDRPYRYRDLDRDGVPNFRDRDRDGDGVGNRYDRRPDNGYRY